MIELARQNQGHPIQLTSIADKYGLSRKYLHNLMTSLRNQGLVSTRRGAKGGFMLTSPAEETSAWQILSLLEGQSRKYTSEVSGESASVVERLVDDLSTTLQDRLKDTSLAQLVKRVDSEPKLASSLQVDAQAADMTQSVTQPAAQA